MCSKHVEIWNKHTRQNNCASSWSFTRTSWNSHTLFLSSFNV